MKKIALRFGFVFGLLAIIVASSVFWFFNLLENKEQSQALIYTTPQQLEYLQNSLPRDRGRVLLVVSSAPSFKFGDKTAGYELTELSRAYYVFRANGFEVDVASPLGGDAPVRLDWGDFGEYDFAFMNDKSAQAQVKNTIAMSDVDPDAYRAVYFVGGKGPMYDFPDNPHIQNVIRTHIESGKVVGAVCHGPSALVNVQLSNGEMLLSGRKVTSISNQEDTFHVPDVEKQFPFMLESKIRQRGGVFNSGPMYLNNVIADGNLLTGQNPWSVWQLVEDMIRKMGYEPISREPTAEENAVDLLLTYEQYGFARAKSQLNRLLLVEDKLVERDLIAIHAVLALWEWDIKRAMGIVRLTHAVKSLQQQLDHHSADVS